MIGRVRMLALFGAGGTKGGKNERTRQDCGRCDLENLVHDFFS
jgi:hypothetical protein